MCRKKPWPRCAYHARKRLEKAEATGDRRRILEAREEYLMTPTGWKSLQAEGRLKAAERYKAKYIALTERIKQAEEALEKNPSAKRTSKRNRANVFISRVNKWAEVETQARINIQHYAGKKYLVDQEEVRSNSTRPDILVTNKKTGKSGYFEVKSLPSRAGIQTVVTVDAKGNLIPSSSSQGNWVKALCDISNTRNNRPSKDLTPAEQATVNKIVKEYFKKKNIIGFVYTDSNGDRFDMCETADIDNKIDIVLDPYRHKESGSSRWAKKNDGLAREIIENAGFSSRQYKLFRQGDKMYVRFRKTPDFTASMTKNQNGWAAPETNGVSAQFSENSSDSKVFELRQRSSTANPTLIIRFKKAKNPVKKFDQATLDRILAKLS